MLNAILSISYKPPKYGTANSDDLTEHIETASGVPSIIIVDVNLPDIVQQSGKSSVKQNSQRVRFHQSALDLIGLTCRDS